MTVISRRCDNYLQKKDEISNARSENTIYEQCFPDRLFGWFPVRLLCYTAFVIAAVVIVSLFSHIIFSHLV